MTEVRLPARFEDTAGDHRRGWIVVAAIFVATLALGGAGLLAGSASAAVVGFAFAGWTGLLLWRTRQPTSLEVAEVQA
jgi:hypothetical protein